jgi:hypothetical protein
MRRWEEKTQQQLRLQAGSAPTMDWQIVLLVPRAAVVIIFLALAWIAFVLYLDKLD